MYRLLLLVCLSLARGRDARFFKTLPTVTNSLVNLGKMDIAFYINAKPQDLKSDVAHTNTFLTPSEAADEPCPCSSLKYFKDASRSQPSDILSRILTNNDLFSFREPSMSTLCCDSHEQVREDSIVFEFGPKQSQMIANPAPSSRFPIPFLIDNLIANKPFNTQTSPTKHKFVELLLFPQKKEIALDLGKIMKKKDIHKEGTIKIVGDKEIRNDFKTMKFIPPLSASVKKDLTVQENKNKIDINKQDEANANTSKANVV
ncbi:uncharacterized protein LOC123695577 isoform X2 [Colias croceus]|nr:uncharacterized protein LOC123695577 isoform X2 [Colias croceus]XP_045497427.1 uncharacterized protein LOC123695577 isoform X2 [Colias croceus]